MRTGSVLAAEWKDHVNEEDGVCVRGESCGVTKGESWMSLVGWDADSEKRVSS